MYGRGMRGAIAATGMLAIGLTMGACGNQTDGGTPSSPTSTTSSANTPPTEGPTKPAPERTIPVEVATPTATPTQRPVVRLTNGMLVTGQEVAKADPNRGWKLTTGSTQSICGVGSTRGNAVKGSLTRRFTTELDADGSQYLTRYDSPAAAKAAYEQIVATIKSCKSLDPAPTHARKLTENRKLDLGDATTILRWYDYPLPSDPGSEDGGFPYAVTRQGSIVSVLAFREMGTGVKPAHFESLARTAAGRLG